MFKKQHLALAIAATLAAGAAQAALETSVVLKNETARFLKDGIRNGEATNNYDTTGEGKTTFKFENTAKIFLNEELENGGSWHGELNIVRDTKSIDDYKSHETNTQKDWLRELYVDTTAGDWDLRLGKQQVVWGTADGMKLLDMINPTDWSEFNQNTMADARIPVWMLNGEKYLENGANVQVVISEAEKNKIAGLNSSGDQGHPFVMKGVDTITGKVNGFLNIVPALGKIANSFSAAAYGTMFGGQSQGGLAGFTGTSVDGFSSSTIENAGTKVYMPGLNTTNNNADADYGSSGGADMAGYLLLNNIAQNGITGLTSNANNYITNVMPTTSNVYSATAWNPDSPTSAFEYMPNATFATFNTFSGATSRYVVEKPDDPANFGFRFKNTVANGLNYSLNYAYRYSTNPTVNMSWHDTTTGEELTVQRASYADEWHSVNGAAGQDSSPDYADTGSNIAASSVPNSFGLISILLKNSAGEYYGDYSPNPFDGVTLSSNDVELRFTEKMHRVNSIGTSLDYSLDLEDTPVVLRGEFLYEKGDKQPVVDKRLLAIGDLTNALSMEEADYFKYVIGADVTVLTDMMLSGQFIQFRNLDYVNEKRTCTTQGDLQVAGGGSLTTYGVASRSFDCSKYTGDMATLGLTNGMKQAEENKNFYSVFLSKPFGESGEGRWNNIFIYEEGGGKWNRFDVEYGFDDQLIGTFEVNKYFGDNDTMFGQFENNSNVQIGVKYLLQ